MLNIQYLRSGEAQYVFLFKGGLKNKESEHRGVAHLVPGTVRLEQVMGHCSSAREHSTSPFG